MTAASCGHRPEGAEEPDQVPLEAGPAAQGWELGSPASAGLDEAILSDLVREIESGSLTNLHSVLIVKDGRLVFEEYFEGTDEYRGDPLGEVHFDQATLHDLRSVTKSITSALVGIAVGDGAVTIDDRVFEILPGHSDLASGPKAGLTVGHLLTMTSGLEWDERTYPYTDPRNSETAMDLSESSVRYVLESASEAVPGERFQYCGGCTMLLAAVIREVTGSDLDAFAQERLFTPLGITEAEWLRHRDGLPIAASGLRLRPRDLAKIGYLYSNGGRWGTRQVIPEPWVQASVDIQVQLDSIAAYGYQWWVDLEPVRGELTPIAVARGNGGQRIYVVPPLDLIAVITAGNYNSPDVRLSEQAFWRYVLPAASRTEDGAVP